MDISEKYILMCEKSPLKEEHEWNWGDLYYDPENKSFGVFLGLERLQYSQSLSVYVEGIDLFSRDSIPYRLIPVYRQDQLQEMVDDIPFDFTFQHREDKQKYIGFASIQGDSVGKDYDVLPAFRVASMEQLWLAFVMHEKHQKRWDEEKGEWLELT